MKIFHQFVVEIALSRFYRSCEDLTLFSCGDSVVSILQILKRISKMLLKNEVRRVLRGPCVADDDIKPPHPSTGGFIVVGFLYSVHGRRGGVVPHVAS